MRRAIMSSAWRWPMMRCSSVSASLSTASTSFLTMRPTGMPVQLCDDAGDRLVIDGRQDQRRSPCSLCELALQLASSSSRSSAPSRSSWSQRSHRSRPRPPGRCGFRGGVCCRFQRARRTFDLAAAAAQLAADLEDLVDQLLLRVPALVELLEPRLLRVELLVGLLRALGGIDTDGRFAADDRELGLQRLDALARSRRPPAARRAG